MTETTYTVQQ